MNSSNLAKKLCIQPGQRALFINAPEGYLDALDPLPENVSVESETGRDLDFVHLFVKNNAELEKLGGKAVDATWSALRFRPPEKVGK